MPNNEPEILISDPIDNEAVVKIIEDLPAEVLSKIAFSSPWGTEVSAPMKDEDGFDTGIKDKNSYDRLKREELQTECWNKFLANPQVNTAIRGMVGRLTGAGFGAFSHIPEIQEFVDEITNDYRNRLYTFWTKYVARATVEGELFLMITPHRDGFCEVDYIDPSVVQGGANNEGIIYHPAKTLLPLVYNLDDGERRYQVPSIYLAYDPSLLNIIKGSGGGKKDHHKHFDPKIFNKEKSRAKWLKPIGGFKRFVISWDKSFVSERNFSSLRTTLEWINYYENLKKYEIDHKKSAGAYVWAFSFEDQASFRTWINMTEAQRKSTAMMGKLTPGSKMFLPPGVTLTAVSPELPSISDADTDIMQMITSGLNEAADVTTGQSKGTYASVKMSRGPMSDRTSDEMAFFERFLIFDFWKPIFYIKSALSKFPKVFKVEEAVGFKKPKGKDAFAEPIFKDVDRKPEELVDIVFPTSEMDDPEGRAKAYLGVKHGSLNDVAGLPMSRIVKKLGFNNFPSLRLQNETEKRRYPELLPNIDDEAAQEKKEAEPPKSKKPASDSGKGGK